MVQQLNETEPNRGPEWLSRISRWLPKTAADAIAPARTLSWHLGAATLIVALPLIVVTFIMVGWIARGDRQAKQTVLVGDAHALADAVARQIDKYFLLSNALSHSSLLLRGDFTGFERQAKEILAGVPEITLIVSGADGRPLVSVPRLTGDSPLWRDRAGLVKESIGSSATSLSDVSADAASHEAHASIETPVLSDGKAIYEIALVLSLDQFSSLLERQEYPKGWLSGIVDRKGIFVARLPNGSTFRGTPASQEFRDAAQHAPESVVSHYSVDGQQLISAYAAMPNGWTVGVAAGTSQFDAGPSALVLTALLATAALAASLILSFLNGSRLARQVRELQTSAEHVFVGAPIDVAPTGVREFDGLSAALARASRLLNQRLDQQRRAEEDLRKSEEHFRLLADSLPQLVWTAGPDGRVDYTNARRENYGAGGLSRTDWEGIIHPDDRRATAEAWLRASNAGAPYEMEHRLLVIGRGYAWHLSRAVPKVGPQGVIDKWYGTTTDIDYHKKREGRIRSLIAEVNHRSRNLLAVAQAIARQSLAKGDSAQDFEQKFSRRLLGLIASQGLLTGQEWSGVPLEALVQSQTVDPLGAAEGRLSLEGPAILLNPAAAQALGLALHELWTNAVKYGALSTDRGHIAVSWEIDEAGAESRFEMKWCERGGPPVLSMPAPGFGRVLMERMVAQALIASANLTFEIEGVTWRLSAPLKEIAANPSVPSPVPTPPS